MSYTLDINASVSGAPQVTALSGATDKLTGSTSRLNDVLYGAAGATEKQTLATIKYNTELAKIEQLTIRYRIEQEAAAAATMKGAVAQEALAVGTGRVVSSTMAASTAMRVMEGSMPIRAAANLLGSIQGIGTAMQFAFPIFGAIALIGVFDKIIGKVAELANAHNPVIAAQELSLSLITREGEEYDKLAKKVRDLNREKLGLQLGKDFVGGLKASDYARAAKQEDQDDINKLTRLAAAVDRISKVVSVGGGNVASASILTEGDTHLAAQVKAALGRDDKTGLEGLVGHRGQTPSVGEARAAGDLSVGLDAAIARAREKQRVDLAAGSLETTKIDEGAKTAGETAAAKAARELAAAIERVTEAEKHAAEGFNRAIGRESFGSKLDSDVANVRAETSDQLRKETRPGLRSRISQAGAVREYSAILQAKDAAGKLAEKLDESIEEMLFKMPGEIATGQRKQVEGMEAGLSSRKGVLNEGVFGETGRLVAMPAGYTSPQQALRDAQDRERRGMSQMGARNTLAGGSEGDLVNQTYNARIQSAKEELAAQLRIVAVKNDLVARQDALDAMEQKSYDARMERENALLQMAVRQKQEFQSLAVGLVDAARSGNVAGFFKGQLNKIEDTAVSRLAGVAWGDGKSGISGALSQVIPKGGPLDKIFGLGVGGAAADPIKAATDANTAATDANTAALLAGGGGSAGGGSAGGGYGTGKTGGGSPISAALKTFGILDSYGRPAKGGGSYEETDTPTYGLPTDGQHSGGDSGENSSSDMSRGTKGLGIASAAAAGAYGIYSGVHAGGARGGLTAAGSGLAMVGAILPLISKSLAVAGPIGMAAGMALGLVTTLMGDPKANREAAISRTLQHSQYMAPVAINASMTAGGGFADYDRFGGVRGSNLSPFPSVEQGFFDYRRGVTVPGRSLDQFGGASGGNAGVPPIVIQVQTLDSRSFNDNSHLIAGAVNHALMTGKSPDLQNTLRSQ